MKTIITIGIICALATGCAQTGSGGVGSEGRPRAEAVSVQEDELFVQGLCNRLDEEYQIVFEDLDANANGKGPFSDAEFIASERTEAARRLKEAKAALRSSYMAHAELIDAIFGKRARQKLTAQEQGKCRQELKRQLQFDYAEGMRLLLYMSPWSNPDDFNSEEGFDKNLLYPLPEEVEALTGRDDIGDIHHIAAMSGKAEEMMQGRLEKLRQGIRSLYFEGGANMGRGYRFGAESYADDEFGDGNPYWMDEAEMKKAAAALARAEREWDAYRKAMARIYNPITGYVGRWAFEYIDAMSNQMRCAHERYLLYLLKGDFGSGK